METLKVCMLDPLFMPYPGGTEKVVYHVSKRLAKKGHDITVLTSQMPNTSLREEMDGIHVIRLPSIYFETLPFPFLPPPFTITPTLNFELLNLDSDIFHIHNRFWYYPGTLLAIKLLKRKKLMLTLHNARALGIDWATDTGCWLYDTLWANRIMENCDRITAVSEWTKRITVPERLWPRTTAIINGVDIERFIPRQRNEWGSVRERFGIGNEEVLLTVARMVKQKGYEYLLDAFSMLKQEKGHRDAKLLVIGRGPYKEQILKQAKDLGVADSFFIAQGVSEANLPLYYNAADLFVLPSVWEPCGLVVLEAMASGTPVVSFACGGPEEIVDESCGRIAKLKSSKDLFLKIRDILDDDKLKGRLSAGARKKSETDYAWEVVADKFEKVYKSLY